MPGQVPSGAPQKYHGSANGLLFWDSTYNKVQYFENTKVSQQQYRNEMENPSYKEAGLGDTHTPQTFTSRNPTQPGIV